MKGKEEEAGLEREQRRPGPRTRGGAEGVAEQHGTEKKKNGKLDGKWASCCQPITPSAGELPPRGVRGLSPLPRPWLPQAPPGGPACHAELGRRRPQDLQLCVLPLSSIRPNLPAFFFSFQDPHGHAPPSPSADGAHRDISAGGRVGPRHLTGSPTAAWPVSSVGPRDARWCCPARRSPATWPPGSPAVARTWRTLAGWSTCLIITTEIVQS